LNYFSRAGSSIEGCSIEGRSIGKIEYHNKNKGERIKKKSFSL